MSDHFDNFESEEVYEDRMHERKRFSLSVKDKQYKGNFHDNEIRWLQPHPKQDLDPTHLEWIEREIHQLLGQGKDEPLEDVEGTLEEVKEDIEVEPFLKAQSHEAYQFKLTIAEEEFKGIIFRDGALEWLRPKPKQKVKDKDVEKIEKKVHEKVEEQKRSE